LRKAVTRFTWSTPGTRSRRDASTFYANKRDTAVAAPGELQITRTHSSRLNTISFVFLLATNALLSISRSMNSYPSELLAQLAPIMFVAGLDIPNTPSEQAEPPSSSPSVTTQPPPLPSKAPQQDHFAGLILRLRDVLLAQRKPAMWQSEKSKTFQTILVDRVRLNHHILTF